MVPCGAKIAVRVTALPQLAEERGTVNAVTDVLESEIHRPGMSDRSEQRIPRRQQRLRAHADTAGKAYAPELQRHFR